MSARIFGLMSGGLAVLGLGWGARSAVGIARRPSAPDAAKSDMFWYGVAPAIVYLALGIAALGLLSARPWGSVAVAASLMALLLVSIHAEWDLVTYLAPISGQPPPDNNA
jgi:hypothetical protein